MANIGDKKEYRRSYSRFGIKEQNFVKPKKIFSFNAEFDAFQLGQSTKPKFASAETFLSEKQRPEDAIQPLKEESKVFTQPKEAFTGENLIDPKTEKFT